MTTPGRILLADDDPDCRDMYGEILLLAGHTVITAADGEEAVLHAKRLPFDLIILDLALPRIDGYAVMKKLRADPATQAIPILTVSAGTEQMHTAALAAGATLTLEKPCLPQELERTVRALLDAPVPPAKDRQAQSGGQA